MNSSSLCLEISRLWRGWLSIDIRLSLSNLWSSSSFPKEQWATWPHFVLTALQLDSQYFLVFRLPPPDCTFLEIDASLLESFVIARLFPGSTAYLATWAVCSGESFRYGPGEGRSLALGSDARLAVPFSLHCCSPVVSLCLGFRIRKRPRLNRKYFNRATTASEPCYNGTIYDRNFANEKISQINFRDFAQIAKNVKVKPRKIFPLYGSVCMDYLTYAILS